ncbi:hypothetical protein ASF69_01765 [Rhizobium sp. Leaf311]|uniref:hypothetical protein n=1 Tax=Rhizobium sp. Leaf311 TaxID=1736332 RepID=UPI00071279EE|nr:hypothetical protein [Rhizobium sp. Leaf311]KQQ61177.1 hypothetical protein ASF69_01765 [Rhizobium sp. Leaf311]
MKKEPIDFFKADYPQWWHLRLEQFPVGWTDLLTEFFRALDSLNSAVSQPKVWVSVHFERSEVGPWTAYIAPAVRMKDWSADDALHALTAVEKVNFAMSRTCEICGVFNGIPRLHPKPERILCEEHRNVD